MTSTATSADERRWFGSGHSKLPDPADAGAAAAKAAVGGRTPAVVFVFCAVGYQVPAMFDAIREQLSADTILVGCTASGQIGGGEADTDGVAVAAWGGPGLSVSSRVAHPASGRLRDAGAEAAGCLTEVDGEHRALLMFCDGLAGPQHEIVRGAFSVAGSTVPLIGGCASDEEGCVRTYQFHGGRNGVDVLSDAVVGVAIGSDSPVGVGIAHGWRKDGPSMVVTSSRDGRVFELDGEPALDVVLRRLGLAESAIDDEPAFRAAAFAHPIGLSRRSGEDIRVIFAGNRSDRSLTCLADVPQGALVWLMQTDDESLTLAAGEAATQAIGNLDGDNPVGLLIFDCAARQVRLGPAGVQRENADLRRSAGDVPYAGFYTNGEIARTKGTLGMHHFTVAAVALA